MIEAEKDCPCFHSKEGCNYSCPCFNPYMSGVCINKDCQGTSSLEDIYLAMKYKESRERGLDIYTK